MKKTIYKTNYWETDMEIDRKQLVVIFLVMLLGIPLMSFYIPSFIGLSVALGILVLIITLIVSRRKHHMIKYEIEK